jgi:hypothetical protein
MNATVGSSVVNAQLIIDKVFSKPAALEGGRHDDILHRMAQLYANGIPREVAIHAVSSVYPIGSGERKITRKELEDAFDGADKLGYKPWSIAPRQTGLAAQCQEPEPRRFEPTGKRTSLPDVLAKTSASEFLKRLYEPADWICVTLPDQDGKPRNANEIHMVQEWPTFLDQFPESYSGDDGAYFVINPLQDQVSRTDKDVANFRYVLIELEVPKNKRPLMSPAELQAACERFYAALLESNLPFLDRDGSRVSDISRRQVRKMGG